MECGLATPQEFAVCIDVATRWLNVLINFAGLGTLALISMLIWLFQRLRKDLEKWEDEVKDAKEKLRLAKDTAKQAENRAVFAEAAVDRAQIELKDLRDTMGAVDDEIKAELAKTKTRLNNYRSKVEAAVALTAEGTNKFWSSPVGNRFEDYERLIASSIPILLFGNQKGGVGKSTLVTNLAAAFAERGERVLTVDLDYQGSHSNLCELQAQKRFDDLRAKGLEDIIPESNIDHLFQERLDPNWQSLAIRKVQPRLDYISAFYDFEKTERQVEYQWALGLTSDDVRYRLARALLSPDLQQEYDRILIDAPPRFTLGFINGFCAATHMYSPMVVDDLSARAVRAFADQFMKIRPIVNPFIRWPGIIGAMAFPNPKRPMSLANRSAGYADRAERTARTILGGTEPAFIQYPVIERSARLAHASAEGIGYFNDLFLRPMFDKLALAIERQAPRRT